jgi:predicted enzyme related to lactoylglutathione lyase
VLKEVVVSLYRVILPVKDIEQAAKFYAAVLGEPGSRVSGGRHYFGGSKSGGAILACYSPKDDGDVRRYGDNWRQHPLQYVYFAVDDLDAARVLCISAGAQDVTDIAKMPWGETMFYALDPFENPISFVQAGTEFTG